MLENVSMLENNRQTKVMLILVSFPKKFSFCANEKFIDFETTLKSRGFSPVGVMGNFAGGRFFVGWWESDKE